METIKPHKLLLQMTSPGQMSDLGRVVWRLLGLENQNNSPLLEDVRFVCVCDQLCLRLYQAFL